MCTDCTFLGQSPSFKKPDLPIANLANADSFFKLIYYYFLSVKLLNTLTKLAPVGANGQLSNFQLVANFWCIILFYIFMNWCFYALSVFVLYIRKSGCKTNFPRRGDNKGTEQSPKIKELVQYQFINASQSWIRFLAVKIIPISIFNISF